MFLQKAMPALYTALGVYLPLITTNCAVLGVVLLNVQNGYNFIESVVYGITGGLGFLLAIVLFASIRVTFNMVILIMTPVGRVQRRHFWENSLRLVPVKIRHVVNGTTCVWIFAWSGGRIHLLRLFFAPVAVIRKQTRKMLPDRIPGITPTIR